MLRLDNMNLGSVNIYNLGYRGSRSRQTSGGHAKNRILAVPATLKSNLGCYFLRDVFYALS